MVLSEERRYLLVGVAIVFGGLGATCLFNLWVDPYSLYQVIESKEFDYNMTHTAPWRLETAYRIRRKRVDTVIMGSSRAISGLSVHDTVWDSAKSRAISIALPGVNMREINAYFKHAHTIQPLSQAVLGLDFFSFNAFSSVREDFDSKRLVNTSFSTQVFALMRDMTSTLLTLDALRASRDELLKTKKEHNDKANIGKPYRKIFKTMERAYIRGLWFPCPVPRFSLDANDMQVDQMAQFREIIVTAKKDDINLHIFISPIHARLHEALYQVGLWEEYERWKRKLVNIVFVNNNSNPRGVQLKIWDFSGYNAYTTEKVPAEADTKGRMDWYLDSAHYTSNFGHLILIEMFGGLDNNSADVRGIGRLLNFVNIEEHLEQLRYARKIYAQNHPEDVDEIIKAVKETQGYRSQKQCRLY